MASLEAGRRLADRYELKERLGDGGHAEVWAAFDQHAQQLVALKFLHLRACAPDEALPVLRHEAQMAQRLEHPGVLRVEAPQRDSEFVFLPIEYAPGGGAAQLRGAHWRRVLPVLLQVAGVLEHAHGRGVVHRDIKPGNVLFGADGLVRVADFGASTHAGSTEALAAGSPFSASPQQLRGEAASAADDVYGLGALAYELLTRYPPFYPDFDATRVQEQDPPRPVSVHAAPDDLLDLVQAMLAREAAARPSLPAVVQAFEACLALPGQPEEGSVLIQAASLRTPAGVPPRRQAGAWWWLGAAAAAGAAALVLLPEPASKPLRVAPPAAPVPVSVADAVVPEAGTAGAATGAGDGGEVAATGAPAPQPVVASAADEVRAGQQALAQLKPAEARAAFQRALLQQADHPEAKAGLAAASRQDELLEMLAGGTRAEAAGDLEAARQRYRLLLANQADFAPARSALARVDSRLADRAFEDHLAAAAAALRRGRVDDAESAYARAAAIHARDARVLDGQLRIAEIHRDRQNALDLEAGAGLEGAERWDAAVAHYRGTLERDANLRFARDGLARSERRLALDQEINDYMQRPERLIAGTVRQAAQRALARGGASATESPRLASQLDWLQRALASLREPVLVELTSDNSTRVSVMQVGELGSFQSHELTLPPGQYTVIGRRDGFRDVRFELNLAPGQRGMALSVQCTERI